MGRLERIKIMDNKTKKILFTLTEQLPPEHGTYLLTDYMGMRYNVSVFNVPEHYDSAVKRG